MLEVVPYELDEVKNELKRRAISELGLTDAEFEGSNISQLIQLLAYSTVINNTNFTFGLNEMFISQARDRRNVIKHARQMGYSHKRKVSYQYKIKLKVLKSGEVPLHKYSNFSSNGNNYVYFGESVYDVYGTYAFIKPLINEFNNNMPNAYNAPALNKGNYVISEEGQVLKVLGKDPVGEPRLLLEVLNNEELPVYSKLGQDIYVQDSLEGTRNRGYRNFKKVGTIDTFVTDRGTEEFKIQLTLERGVEFPVQVPQIHNNLEDTLTKSGEDFILSTETEFRINNISSLILTKADEADIEMSLLNIKIENKNIIIPGDRLEAREDYTDLEVLDDVTHKSKLIIREDIIDDSFRGLSFLIDDKEYIIPGSEYSVDYDNKEVIINEKTETRTDSSLDVDEAKITASKNTIKTVKSVTIIDTEDDSKIPIDNDNYKFGDTIITLINADGSDNNDYDDDRYKAEITYIYYLKIDKAVSTITYSYIKDITDYNVKMKYTNIYDKDDYLVYKMFFSDYRGETKDNENDYDAKYAINGWNGFYATKFNSLTNVLHFDISESKDLNRSYGQDYNNTYVSIDEKKPLKINELITTPFKKTRLSFTDAVINGITQEIERFLPFDENRCFSSVNTTNVKNEIEIIVKEGTLRRWNTQTQESIDSIAEAKKQNLPIPKPIYENEELTVPINEDMVKSSYFAIQNNDIENDGIELFVTRVLDDGTIEYDEPWNRRDYLLAEQTETGGTSFVAMSDVDYEDYINIHTRYAGTGTPLSLDMTAKINLLTSKGKSGSTKDLIVPIDNEDFEEKYFIEETMTPNVLHIEGSEVQDTDSIRETAPLFSNTANRAVTKNDYKTICEAQPYIRNAQIWGGEEELPSIIPGNIYFSFIPYSRPVSFIKSGLTYTLENADTPELFFTSYYQITGKKRYDTPINSKDRNVLFNLLNDYKIITLNLNYVKPIYVDYEVQVKVLKYKFGQTVDETNENIFNNVKEYFVREIEKFDSSFFMSSLTKAVDEKIGDNYGISLDMKLSTPLYDSLYEPDKGVFTNITNLDLTDTDNNKGLIGDNDLWSFKMPLGYPIEDLFASGSETASGESEIIKESITSIDTDNFIELGDKLFLELDESTFTSRAKTVNNVITNKLIISVMYKRNDEYYKVGNYTIYKNQKIIILEIFSSNYKNIDEGSLVTEDMQYPKEDLGKNIYYKVDSDTGDYILEDGSKVETLEYYENVEYPNVIKPYVDEVQYKEFKGYKYKEIPFSRNSFTDKTRVMNVIPEKGNIKFLKNVFCRFKGMEFLSL